MPLIPFAGRLYSIPKSELEKYQVTREQASELGIEMAEEGDEELSSEDLEQVGGGFGTISLDDPNKLELADPNRLRLSGQFFPGPQPQWYSGD